LKASLIHDLNVNLQPEEVKRMAGPGLPGPALPLLRYGAMAWRLNELGAAGDGNEQILGKS
jgi:hypothetical protein